ncbi:expressed unknown protein [Seminavis robusta]|uniref:Uncharacterized protein n=1 Tax=Seminavis robusta TaxID=568900 RepID=A0A9N8E116_9STRA|nr:expressed unknown protein [Seminavis robusta]|eukprot:Sro512_g157680.1 n/a (164) ;mRNA; r:39060-39551
MSVGPKHKSHLIFQKKKKQWMLVTGKWLKEHRESRIALLKVMKKAGVGDENYMARNMAMVKYLQEHGNDLVRSGEHALFLALEEEKLGLVEDEESDTSPVASACFAPVAKAAANPLRQLDPILEWARTYTIIWICITAKRVAGITWAIWEVMTRVARIKSLKT